MVRVLDVDGAQYVGDPPYLAWKYHVPLVEGEYVYDQWWLLVL